MGKGSSWGQNRMSSDQYFGPASCPLVLNMGDGREDTETLCRVHRSTGHRGWLSFVRPFSWYLDISVLGQQEAGEGLAFWRGDSARGD